MNQKAKPHKQFFVVGDQNGIRILGLCHFVSEEFDHNNLTLIALYYGKIYNSSIVHPKNVAWPHMQESEVIGPSFKNTHSTWG